LGKQVQRQGHATPDESKPKSERHDMAAGIEQALAIVVGRILGVGVHSNQ
jgi:hypothetical protein